MLQRVMLDGIELPRLYIAENRSDAELAKDKGIPFIRWSKGQDELIRILLRPVLEQMFPHIKWSKVLGPKRRFRTQVEVYDTIDPDKPDLIDEVGRIDGSHALDPGKSWHPDGLAEAVPYDGAIVDDDEITELSVATTGERTFSGGGLMVMEHKLDLADYVGDMSSYVNIEVLQRLRLMPAFIGDILDCVKLNVGSGMYWREGYNKRLGLTVGRFNASGQLPNLVILDVSGSIPRGISATMISLIDTLRTQLSADLIITSTCSRFYPMGTELPDPQTLRNQFGYGNESSDFFGILTKYVRGRHYGHVFSFGDNDTPDYRLFKDYPDEYSLEGAKVEHVHHYHTGSWVEYNTKYNKDKDAKTGYAKWCHMLATQPSVDLDTSWCKVIKD